MDVAGKRAPAICVLIDAERHNSQTQQLQVDFRFETFLRVLRGRGIRVHARCYLANGGSCHPGAVQTDLDFFETDCDAVIIDVTPGGVEVSTEARRALIAADALRQTADFGQTVMFLGDDDYSSLIEALKISGQRVSVVSANATSGGQHCPSDASPDHVITLKPPASSGDMRESAFEFKVSSCDRRQPSFNVAGAAA